MSQKPAPLRISQANLYKELWEHTSSQVVELNHKASDALEALLRLYLHPDAFVLLKRFHREFDEGCGFCGFTFRDALNELGSPAGVAGLQRTLRRIRKEQVAA